MKRLLGLFSFLLLCTICVAQNYLTITNAYVPNNCLSRNNAEITFGVQYEDTKEFNFRICIRATEEGTSKYMDFETTDFCFTYSTTVNASHNLIDDTNSFFEEGCNYTISYYVNGQQIPSEPAANITVRFCPETPVDITVGASGFSTVILPYYLDWRPCGKASQGELKAYTITDVNDKELTLEEVWGTMKANTPYLIQGAAGHYGNDYEGNALYAPLVPEDLKPTTLCTEGLLNGYVRLPDANATCPTGSYVLQTQNGKCAFYKVVEEKPINLVAGKCYLQVPDGSEAKQINFPGFDEANSISSIESSLSDIVAIYDLSGKQQTALTKGLNIIKHANGRMTKILVK